jgi:steroid delta-isomerase-like uncharacterized protein
MPRFVSRLAVLAVLIGVLAPVGAQRILAQQATPCPPLTQEEVDAWVTGYYAARNAQDQEAIASFLSDDFIYHWGIGPDAEGIDEFTSSMTAYMSAFSGLHTTVDQVWVADDTIVVRWINIGIQEQDYMGVPPSQETVTWTGISIFRLECGKAVEGWSEADHFGRIQQQGAIPVPEATPAT